MDSLITAAARALVAGDPLGALNRVALRDDAPALALRGIAMAQLGDLVRAKALVLSAARAFGPKEAVARARCVVAEAEIAQNASLAQVIDHHGDNNVAAISAYRFPKCSFGDGSIILPSKEPNLKVCLEFAEMRPASL